MSKWIDLGPASEFPSDCQLSLQAEGQKVVICHAAGKLTAFDDTCPHAGLPLSGGERRGTQLTCPFHGYTFDVHTGKNVDYADDVPLAMFPVRVDEGRLMVDVEPGKS